VKAMSSQLEKHSPKITVNL